MPIPAQDSTPARSPLCVHPVTLENWCATSRPHIDRSLPDAGRSTPKSKLRHDQPDFAGRRFRTRHPSTTYVGRSAGDDADRTHFALAHEGRGCFGSTAHLLVEEIDVLRGGQLVLVKRSSEDFQCHPVVELEYARLALRADGFDSASCTRPMLRTDQFGRRSEELRPK
jgi:hypothetical protein